MVIGGGPGGYVAGIRAAQLGMKSAVVEASGLGGVCTNWGCIPTKALLRAAEVYEIVQQADTFGLQVGKPVVDWPAVIGRSRDVAGRLAKGIEHLFKKNKVAYHPGMGRLTAADRVEVTPDEGKPYTLEAKHVMIATGARPRVFPGLEPDGERVITAKQAMTLPAVPKRLVIIGAGAIGVEFAYLYNVFGSQVTLIELLPAILPTEDANISRELARQFKKRKIKMLTGTKVEQLEVQKSQVKVHTSGDRGETITADVVLLAMGVQGNVERLGLEELGVLVKDGAVPVDEFYRTSVEGVLAVGDLIGPPWLAHAASAEALVAVEHLAGREVRPVDYGNIPACTYCQPQVASVGLTERAAREAGYELKVGKFPFRALGKAVVAGEIEGFVKMIYDARYGELLGAHIIGANATELISGIATARTLEATQREIIDTIHPHPTMSEAVMEASALAWGESVNY